MLQESSRCSAWAFTKCTAICIAVTTFSLHIGCMYPPPTSALHVYQRRVATTSSQLNRVSTFEHLGNFRIWTFIILLGNFKKDNYCILQRALHVILQLQSWVTWSLHSQMLYCSYRAQVCTHGGVLERDHVVQWKILYCTCTVGGDDRRKGGQG